MGGDQSRVGSQFSPLTPALSSLLNYKSKENCSAPNSNSVLCIYDRVSDDSHGSDGHTVLQDLASQEYPRQDLWLSLPPLSPALRGGHRHHHRGPHEQVRDDQNH